MHWKQTIGGILFFFILFLSVGSGSPAGDAERLIDVFHQVGGKPEKIVLHHGGRTQTPWSRKEVFELARKLSRDLDLGPARQTEDRHGHRWTAEGEWERNLQVRLNVINDRVELQKNRPYISVQLSGRGHSDREWSRFRHRLEKLLIRNGIDPHIQFSIQGSRPGGPIRKRRFARSWKGWRREKSKGCERTGPPAFQPFHRFCGADCRRKVVQ